LIEKSVFLALNLPQEDSVPQDFIEINMLCNQALQDLLSKKPVMSAQCWEAVARLKE